LDERLAKVEGATDIADATNQAKETINSAASSLSDSGSSDDAVKKAVEDALKKQAEKDKDCHEPPVYVGKNNIPAEETRSVLYVSDPKENEAKIAAVETPPELVTDQDSLDAAQDSIDKSTDEISKIHDDVKALAEEPLVPEVGEQIMAKVATSDDQSAAE